MAVLRIAVAVTTATGRLKVTTGPRTINPRAVVERVGGRRVTVTTVSQ